MKLFSIYTNAHGHCIAAFKNIQEAEEYAARTFNDPGDPWKIYHLVEAATHAAYENLLAEYRKLAANTKELLEQKRLNRA